MLNNSVNCVPAFAMCLMAILLLRNYVKYHIRSTIPIRLNDGFEVWAQNYRRFDKSIGVQCRASCSSSSKRHSAVLETLLLKLFGMNSLLVLDHRKDDSWSTKCYFVIVGEASASRPLGKSFSSHSHQASTDIQEAINWRSENAVALYDDEFSSGDEGIHMIQSK